MGLQKLQDRCVSKEDQSRERCDCACPLVLFSAAGTYLYDLDDGIETVDLPQMQRGKLNDSNQLARGNIDGPESNSPCRLVFRPKEEVRLAVLGW